MDIAKLRSFVDSLPPAQGEACNELIDWIRRSVDVAGDPVGPLAVAVIEAELRESGRLIRAGRSWPGVKSSR